MVCFWNEERPHCFVVCLNKPFPDQPACIKPQTSISMKRIQRLFQIAVKTKESAAFSDNLAAFRIHRCARRCTSALFTGAGISTLKSICRHALSSHHAAVIVSSIYSNYSFHHFWFTKKRKKEKKKAVNTSFECFTQFFFFLLGKKPSKKPKCHIVVVMLIKDLIQMFCRRVFWCFHEVSCWYFDGKTLMFTAVANLLTITTLQTESREAIAFNSVSAYFAVLHFIKKNKNKKPPCSKHKPPSELHYYIKYHIIAWTGSINSGTEDLLLLLLRTLASVFKATKRL